MCQKGKCNHKKNILSMLPYAVTALIVGGIVYVLNHYRWEIQLLIISERKRQEFFGAVTPVAQDFMTLTFGILIEALPFVVLGVLISALIQTFIKTESLLRILPKNGGLRRLAVSFFGVLMPVCECGNVPVARTLMMKGFSTREAVIFLLAAPSVNIITFIVTLEAFNFNQGVAVVRVIGTLLIANITAYIVTKFISQNKLLTSDFAAKCDNAHTTPKSLRHFTNHFRSELWLITRLLIIGALIAAASQTFVPREVIAAIGSNLLLSVVAMLLLAFVISLCSSVDAFFALAYVNTFSLGSILAFLIAGPMVDIKMIALMKTTFTVRAIALITACVFILSLIIGIGFSYVW